MELNVHENTKLVEVWLTKAEKNDPSIQAMLKALYEKYKKKKYTVAVFYSGNGDLYKNTLDLLAYNKRRCAELIARQSRAVQEARGMDR